MSESEAVITRGIARALGPFLIVFGASVAMKAGDMPLFIPAFFHDAIFVFVIGAFTLGLGCALFAAHHHWSSLAAIIISVFAIATAARGAALLAAPGIVSTLAANVAHVSGLVFIPATIAVIIGAYLSYVGWFSRKQAS